ncbi:hypothetical protein KQH40_01215 [bacterium]|nr:hypothetical protein [bacterium]
MVYHVERKKYKPVLEKAKKMSREGIMLSRRGNVQLIYPKDKEAWLECTLGWKNEKVTHLILEPNARLCDILKKDEEEVRSWIDVKLTFLFGDLPVPAWEI